MINFLSLKEMFLISLQGNPIFGVSLDTKSQSKLSATWFFDLNHRRLLPTINNYICCLLTMQVASGGWVPNALPSTPQTTHKPKPRGVDHSSGLPYAHPSHKQTCFFYTLLFAVGSDIIILSDDISDEDRPQHQKLRPLLFSNSVWVL